MKLFTPRPLPSFPFFQKHVFAIFQLKWEIETIELNDVNFYIFERLNLNT